MNVRSAADFLALTARLRRYLGITPAAGQLVEWAAAEACDGDTSENGTGHDFAMLSSNVWQVLKERAPRALLPMDDLATPAEVSYDKIISALGQRQAKRFRDLVDQWQADDRLWIEVKHHFLHERHLDDRMWFHDTRAGGPKSFFAPVADAYVKVFINPDGALRSAWLIPHADLIQYVREETRRGGAWNYKVAFSPCVPIGIDIAPAMQTALSAPFPEAVSGSVVTATEQ